MLTPRHRFVVVFSFVLTLFATSLVSGQITATTPESRTGNSDRVFDKFEFPASIRLIRLDRSTETDEALGDPCTEAVELAFNQQFTGELTPFDCPVDGFRTADLYLFNGTQGQQVRVEINSTQFATFGGVFNASGFEYEGGGAGGPLTVLTPTLPATGEYLIVVTSYNLLQWGYYTVKVDRVPPCTYQVSPVSIELPPLGGTQFVNVTTQEDCYWTAASNSRPRFSLVDDGSMVNFDGVIRHRGSGMFQVSTELNDSGSTATGSLTVAGQTVSLSQPSLQCTYSLSQNAFSITGARQTFEVDVVTQAGCAWNWIQGATWLGVDNWPPGTVRGPMTVRLAVNSNSGPTARSTTLTLAGLPVTVTQAGLNCTYSVSTNEILVPAENATGTFSVDTQDFCTYGFNTGGNGHLIQLNRSSPDGAAVITYTLQRNYDAEPRTVNVRLLAINSTVSIPINFTQAGAGSVLKTLTGRVISPSGTALRNVTIILTDGQGNRRTTTTSSFGVYSFEVLTGYSYILSASSKRYRFSSQGVFVLTSTGPIDMQALE